MNIEDYSKIAPQYYSGYIPPLLEKCLKNSDITGMDINENMLKRARKIAHDSKSKVKFMNEDVYNLPFKDEEFDVITGLRYLNSSEKKSNLGFYTKHKIVVMANKNGLVFFSEKSILLFGETILRLMPTQLLILAGPIINSSFIMKDFNSKLVLAFRKSV